MKSLTAEEFTELLTRDPIIVDIRPPLRFGQAVPRFFGAEQERVSRVTPCSTPQHVEGTALGRPSDARALTTKSPVR